MNNILQWNVHGLQANRQELNILLSDFNPTLVSLQETFLKHNKSTAFKNYSSYSLLRVLAHTSWGADQETLLHLYRSLIRSKLDYGCIVYGSARGSYLRMLDPIQNHALRLCLGAYRTSPASSLCVEASEPPLYFRRKKLSSIA